MFVDVNDETTGFWWHRPNLYLIGLRKRVVGILCKFQQHAVVSVAVAMHQFVDSLPKELLMLGLADEVRQAVKGISLDPDRLVRRRLFTLPLCLFGRPESNPESFAISDIELLKCEWQVCLD